MRADHPSSTARLIARCTLLASRDPILRTLVPTDAPAPLVAMLDAAGGGLCFDLCLKNRVVRALLAKCECLILPGITAHYLTRKAWIEKRAVTALDAGCTQIVILGAGFDTLSWRLHRRYSAAKFFELDHPATQRPKAAALSPADNLVFLPADLAVISPSLALAQCDRFNPLIPTCFIAEGLFMYFSETRVAEILSDLGQFPRATIAFTYMAPGADGRAAFRGGSPAIGAWLRWRREPFAWAIDPSRLGDFLSPLGLNPHLQAGADELRAQILVPVGLASIALAEGEHLCLASAAP